jgi:hypothetical protein
MTSELTIYYNTLFSLVSQSTENISKKPRDYLTILYKMGYTKEYAIGFVQFLFGMIGSFIIILWITQQVQQLESFV